MDVARSILIRRAAAQEVVDLRHAVLRAGLTRDSAIFPGDDELTTRHFIAVSDRQVVGTLTLHLNHWGGKPAWQLRGMAVTPNLQRSGIGSRLLRAAEESVRDAGSPTHQLWCNARIPAVEFYLNHGWCVVSEPFELPIAGPHVKMIKSLGTSVR
jgi:GNAT superfamily N-acetyltransferase